LRNWCGCRYTRTANKDADNQKNVFQAIVEKGEIVFRARYTKMKLFAGPIAHKVIEGYIEQNICFTRIEKEVNEQLFGDFTISADCLRTHILHKRPITLYYNSFNPMVEINISQIDQISKCDLYFAVNRKMRVFCNVFNMFLIALEVLLAAFCAGAGDMRIALLLLPMGMMIVCNAVVNIVFNIMVEQYTRILTKAIHGK
jgi:hypothetical protein